MDSPTDAPAIIKHPKQYVFVDEYNRHKRLKIMRACHGCRQRKIRCDGALQNGPWPCGACIRLKLKCAPPTLDSDDEQQVADTGLGQSSLPFDNEAFIDSTKAASNAVRPLPVHTWSNSSGTMSTMSNSTPTFDPVQQDADRYSRHLFGQPSPRLDLGHSGDRFVGASATARSPAYSGDEVFPSPATKYSQHQPEKLLPRLIRSQTEQSGSSGGDPEEVDATVRELSAHMGDLAIDETSAAPYIANENKYYAEAPTVEEAEVVLPESVYTDPTVRIPPEMMPPDDRVVNYFGYFFAHIHPYVPVLNRAEFYDQWRTSRHLISPLILEAIFACVARYLDEPLEAQRWLALATKHEEGFKDVPRVSTIQAMLLLTKARESLPKRGYYYRSWMSVKYMTTMGFDLGLHEHYDQHRFEGGCALSKSECTLRKRIWQSLFDLEILVGAPQGRNDFAVEMETVDFDLPPLDEEGDVFELTTSRRCTYFTQCFRNIKTTNSLWQSMRRYKQDWALDPAFVGHNAALVLWQKQLPSDLQLTYAEDGSPPYLGGDHYLAYLHIYHHLVVVMHHRPQLQQMLEKRDAAFKLHLETCLESASMMCRVQEALLRDFGMHGLQFMQRGINFTIYCVLTCAMLHLAAITSPDPVFNSQARMYFTRHMRILEHCIPSSGGQMQLQINTLREAFSADTSQPFELKASLGVRSPASEKSLTPPDLHRSSYNAPVQGVAAWSHLQDASSSKTMSPVSEYGTPIDAVSVHDFTSQPPLTYQSSNFQMAGNTAYATQALHQVTSAPQTGYTLEPVGSNESQTTPIWDPSGIFSQWNTAFGGGAVPQHLSPPAREPRLAPTSHPISVPQTVPLQTHGLYDVHQMAQNTSPVVGEAVPPLPAVTPLMWQDAFTNAYVSGQKRYRSHEHDAGLYSQYNKRRG